jgi:hypothetical protein
MVPRLAVHTSTHIAHSRFRLRRCNLDLAGAPLARAAKRAPHRDGLYISATLVGGSMPVLWPYRDPVYFDVRQHISANAHAAAFAAFASALAAAFAAFVSELASFSADLRTAVEAFSASLVTFSAAFSASASILAADLSAASAACAQTKPHGCKSGR